MGLSGHLLAQRTRCVSSDGWRSDRPAALIRIKHDREKWDKSVGLFLAVPANTDKVPGLVSGCEPIHATLPNAVAMFTEQVMQQNPSRAGRSKPSSFSNVLSRTRSEHETDDGDTPERYW